MIKLKELQVGERYEVQPKDFHRKFIGKVQRVSDTSVLFKVENYESCDQDKINEDKLVEVGKFDIKHLVGSGCFFS